QIRVGRRNQPFRIFKLRTMRPDAESGGAKWASKGDSRVTPTGRLLRKIRLDEVPQFWNVIRGDMAFTGPRPERPEFVGELVEKVPFYNQRHLVKPGLTGWAQINCPYASSAEDSLIKLKYDLYYVKHATLKLDLHILFRTVGAIMKGAR
ncbi:MAG: sugar transferase, partial [Verrucomicrobiales bacterium]|nr:sugar transferase [Verrucomicrobiales bacterium]